MFHLSCPVFQLAARAEYDRNEYVYRQVDMQQAEERQLRDQELERMRMIWFAQMRVSALLKLLQSVLQAEVQSVLQSLPLKKF